MHFTGGQKTNPKYVTIILFLLAGASIQAAPAADFALTATPLSSSQVNLSWDSVNGTADYAIDRRIGSSGAFSQIGLVDRNQTNFPDQGLASSTTYNYQVRAVKNNGSTFATSDIVSARTLSAGDTVSPTVSITSPTSGTTYTSTGTVTLTAAASDNVGVTRVDFYRNGSWQGTDSSAPYTQSWSISQASNGAHSWYARAFDAAGNSTTSSSISLNVNIGSGTDTVPPTISITSPASGSTYSSSQTVVLTATASDNVGVTRVDFYLGGFWQGSDSTSPFNQSWSISESNNGTHSWYSRAFDAAGNYTTSSAISLTVNIGSGQDTTPPSTPTGVSANAVTCNRIDLTWNSSSDPQTGIAYYVIKRDGFLIDSTTATSYQDRFVAENVTATYTVTALNGEGLASTESASAGATTPPCSQGDTTPPSVPTGLAASAQSCSSIGLSWNPSTDFGGSGVKDYWIRKDGIIINIVTSTSYTDSSVAASRSYAYTVMARDIAGLFSAQTAPATATTPSCGGNQPPVANAGSDRTITAGDTVTFNGSGSFDPDGSIVSYSWNFGDGTSASGLVASHVYSNTGTYTATLTVTDNSGATDSDQALVSVQPPSSGNSGELAWSETFGGSSSDIGMDLVSDINDDVLMTGSFLQTASFGGPSLTSVGSKDIFLVKHSSSGNHIWSKRYGGANDESVEGIAIDSSGDVFICGSFTSSTNLGGTTLSSAGLRDMFLAKYSGVDGRHLWSKSFGSPRDDISYDVAVASNGDVLITGFFNDAVDFGGGTLTGAFGGQETFIARLSGASGAHLWSRTFSNFSGDLGSGIALNANDDIFVTGHFTGSSDFGNGSLASAGLQDIYVGKFRGFDGATLWSKRFGGVSDDTGQELAVDTAGNVLVTGYFKESVNFGGGTLTSVGLQDIFLIRLSGNNGNHLWSRRYGGGSVDLSRDVTVSSDGTVLLTGYYQFSANLGAGTFQSAGGQDAFVSSFTLNGSPIWTNSYGASSTDHGNAIAVDGNGYVLVLGRFAGAVDFGDGMQSSAGSNDTFLLRLWP